MQTHTDKSKKNKSQAVSNSLSEKSDTGSTFQLQDNRPSSLSQKKQVEALANNKSTQPAIQKKENKTGLPGQLKSNIENLSGYSMDDVKVHYDSPKPAQLSAHAYAQGTDIHIASAQEKHLPHEAWHVVQQKQGRVMPTVQMKGLAVNNDSSLEKEADVMGNRLAHASFITPSSSLKTTAPSKTVQARFILSNKDKKEIPEDILDLIAAMLREQRDAYVLFQQLREAKKLHSFYGFLTNTKDLSQDLRETITGILDQGTSKEQKKEENKVEFIEDTHYDAPAASSWTPTWFKYLGEKQGEFWSWLMDANRVKMQQTAGNIRATAKASDYQAVRVTVGKIKLLHKLDGDSQSKTDARAKLVEQKLREMINQIVRQIKKKGGKSTHPGIPNALFTFALQKKLFGESNIKVAIDKENNIITLDGVGRIAAIQKALAAVGMDPNHLQIDVLAIHVDPQEYAELHEIHSAYYDETGKQRKEEIKKYNYGLGRTLASPAIKIHGKLTKTVPERDLSKFKVDNRTVFMQNNCLIHAITRAAGMQDPTDFQIIQIRTAIHQPVGEMLYATNQAIQQIRNILNIHQTIRITYGNLIGTGYETETFAGGAGLLNIQHNGYDHFFFDPGAAKKNKKEKKGSVGFHLSSNMGMLDSKSPELAIDLKKIISSFNRQVASKIGSNEKKVLSWLHSSLSSAEFDHMCRGGQIRIKYSKIMFAKLLSLGAEARKSSHYKGIVIPTAFSQIPDQHFGIDGKFFPTILFGRVKDNDGQEYIYIQSERNSYNPSAKLMEKIHHVFDAAKYATEKRNQGPYGESEHTDAHPLGTTPNPSPGYRDLLSPARLQTIPLLLLHQIRGVPQILLENWHIILLAALSRMYEPAPPNYYGK